MRNKKNILAILVIMLSILVFGCSSIDSQSNTEMIKTQAEEYAIKLGDEHYRQRVEEIPYYMSYDKPEVLEIEVKEDKYVDIRCRCYVITAEEIYDVYYNLRLEYLGNSSFNIVEQSWGG